MIEQNFGSKDLYEIIIRANSNMRLGERDIVAGEAVLILKSGELLTVTEKVKPVFARGGYGNQPLIAWEDRQGVTFTLTRGIMSNISFNLLIGAKALTKLNEDVFCVPKIEGPFELNQNKSFILENEPVINEKHKAFCYEYDVNNIQKKVDFSKVGKEIQVIGGDRTKNYVFDYYHQYGGSAIIYQLATERLNALFSMEAKCFYQDENEGVIRTDFFIMPKIRIIGNLNLRYGEKMSPNVESFSIIAMPVIKEGKSIVMEIVHMDSEIE